MTPAEQKLATLRTVITENLRVQRSGAEPIDYIDVSHALSDIGARQNHAIFARRGCGKTLLLQHSSKSLADNVQSVYLNCEDFKHHSFPNVLIEILDALFSELQTNLSGWFGKKKKSRQLVSEIRKYLQTLRYKEDEQSADVVEQHSDKRTEQGSATASIGLEGFNLSGEIGDSTTTNAALELRYAQRVAKINDLQTWLPQLKRQIREFLELSNSAKTIFLQLDDFYHLARADQPNVMDYLHRLCKDLPLYFKVATLRHSSTLYADRNGQAIGTQERHDYQPINIDFAFTDFKRTVKQNRQIFEQLSRLQNSDRFGAAQEHPS